MKKWSSWRQRQYVDNYLLNLETQGEKFHVINVSWFSMKAYHKFCSFNICSSFPAGSIYEDAKHTLQYMPNKDLQLPKSFIVHVWHIQWRKFEAQYLDNVHVGTSRFFMMYWGFCAQKYYDINIGDSCMRLFLGQSKTII